MKYLILLFLGLSTVLSAQTEFAPLGAKWTYDFSNDNTIGYLRWFGFTGPPQTSILGNGVYFIEVIEGEKRVKEKLVILSSKN